MRGPVVGFVTGVAGAGLQAGSPRADYAGRIGTPGPADTLQPGEIRESGQGVRIRLPQLRHRDVPQRIRRASNHAMADSGRERGETPAEGGEDTGGEGRIPPSPNSGTQLQVQAGESWPDNAGRSRPPVAEERRRSDRWSNEVAEGSQTDWTKIRRKSSSMAVKIFRHR